MEITTKYDIGQTIWTVMGCKAVETIITTIQYDAKGVTYRDDKYREISEDCAFPSKESLLRHLAAG